MPATPTIRIRELNRGAVNPLGDYVLYWMIAARRVNFNFALQRAAEFCRELDRPLVVLEALRVAYPWASRRLHAFIIQGMADNNQALAGSQVLYYPYLEREPGAGKGLLASLARRACAVITDDYPCFFLPRMIEAAARQVEARMEAVDSCGLLPLAATVAEFSRALDMRRFLQRHLPLHLECLPNAQPIANGLPPAPRLPRGLLSRWPPAKLEELSAPGPLLDRLPMDQSVGAAPVLGGSSAAKARLKAFISHGLDRYADQRALPVESATSGLSPYLHFGHISAHEVFLEVAASQNWAPHLLNPTGRGRRQGFWGMSPAAEDFLDQLLTWRELGYHFCRHHPGFDSYDSLPAWALSTLENHAQDPRPYLYGMDDFLAAGTHAPLWNAAQRQLLAEGAISNYLRMLWGKKILHWSADPRQALETMIELNNRLALDGRDPNSYSGIFWCLGRFDRPWGPERPVFGKVRYMSSRNTLRKLKLAEYLARYGP